MFIKGNNHLIRIVTDDCNALLERELHEELMSHQLDVFSIRHWL